MSNLVNYFEGLGPIRYKKKCTQLAAFYTEISTLVAMS